MKRASKRIKASDSKYKDPPEVKKVAAAAADAHTPSPNVCTSHQWLKLDGSIKNCFLPNLSTPHNGEVPQFPGLTEHRGLRLCICIQCGYVNDLNLQAIRKQVEKLKQGVPSVPKLVAVDVSDQEKGRAVDQIKAALPQPAIVVRASPKSVVRTIRSPSPLEPASPRQPLTPLQMAQLKRYLAQSTQLTTEQLENLSRNFLQAAKTPVQQLSASPKSMVRTLRQAQSTKPSSRAFPAPSPVASVAQGAHSDDHANAPLALSSSSSASQMLPLNHPPASGSDLTTVLSAFHQQQPRAIGHLGPLDEMSSSSLNHWLEADLF
mmetsp:Transcript_38235/g.75273  ORF Transcript_38235/g.75273 Transcript_38235/m.75273 type:complete len:320 (+) Transcript_38235:85-1044(+)|eukprot:CAMPEP_0175143650 /NCGR_PEP_ID=MMETSP0087-20121206/13587_1 /TAXON_ID=136419 /ORGANISM="Unknown Unknown, Strain D1" /LENGTH=319 /DNA_ID=CAMNT_0016427817 /DNA_START=85 /DNA_END=1044 /DNA_ORIENTATION=-